MLFLTNGIDVPDHLDKNFFRASLMTILQETDYYIEKITFSMGSQSGDNYFGSIIRARIEIVLNGNRAKQINMIIKNILFNSETKIFQIIQMHKKETDMYFKMLPKIEELLKKKLTAKCYYSQEQPVESIVFEDLDQLGYRIGNRQTGLDENHCTIVLDRLGKFHAASLYIAAKDPSLVEQYNSGMFNRHTLKSKIFQSVFLNNFKATIKMVETWPGYETILHKLKKLESSFLAKFAENAEPTTFELKVLNHGDLWVNNIMFKYSTTPTKRPMDLMFIDFQASFYVSPGIDINYFLNTSVQLDVLRNRRNHMLREYYYRAFRETLLELKSAYIPTFDDILAEIRRKEFYGFCSAVGVMGLLCMDKESSKDNQLENFASKEISEQKSLIACSSKRYQDMLHYLLKRNDMLGMFDL